jgi:hypothetical protein
VITSDDDRADPVQVLIPTSLHSYTRKSWVEAKGLTLRALLADLDRQYSGVNFRMIDEPDRMRRISAFSSMEIRPSIRPARCSPQTKC